MMRKLKVHYKYRWAERRWRVLGVLREGDLARRRYNSALAGFARPQPNHLLNLLAQGQAQALQPQQNFFDSIGRAAAQGFF